MEPHFFQSPEFERREKTHYRFGTGIRIAEECAEGGQTADLHALPEIEDLFGERDGFLLEDRRPLAFFHEQVLEGGRERRHFHRLPNFFRGLPGHRPLVDVVAEEREASKFLTGVEEALMLEELTKEIFRRKDVVVAEGERVRIDVDGKERFRLPLDQRRRHHEEIRRDVEVEFLHQPDVGEVLVRDPRNRDLRDVELVTLDQVEEQIEGALEPVDSNVNRYAMSQTSSGGCATLAHLDERRTTSVNPLTVSYRKFPSTQASNRHGAHSPRPRSDEGFKSGE